jgi:hypothetical protein
MASKTIQGLVVLVAMTVLQQQGVIDLAPEDLASLQALALGWAGIGARDALGGLSGVVRSR